MKSFVNNHPEIAPACFGEILFLHRAVMPILDPSPQLITGVMLTTGLGLGLTLSSTCTAIRNVVPELNPFRFTILANHVVRVLFRLEQQHRQSSPYAVSPGEKGTRHPCLLGWSLLPPAPPVWMNRGASSNPGSAVQLPSILHALWPTLLPFGLFQRATLEGCPSPSLKQERSPA